MLKKRVAVAVITLGLSLPGLSSASPLSWVSGPHVLAKLAALWDLLPGTHLGRIPRPAHDQRKNGCGMDPNGTPCNPGPGAGGAPSSTGEPGE